MNKKNIIIIIPALAVLGLLVSFYVETKTEITTSNTKQVEILANDDDQNQELIDAQKEIDSGAHTEIEESHDHNKIKKSDQDTSLKAYPKDFNYKAEANKLSALKKNYPESKRELIDFVSSQNRFSNAKAHSAAELAQRQVGTLKVEALKAIFALEKDKSKLKQDLASIAERAEDPTIAKIAKAALESLNKGRSFFEDTTRALENLPVPD